MADAAPSWPKRASIGPVRHPEAEEAILKAAAEVLEEVGYQGLTLDAVVKRAGSSKPTIYRRWRNKGALIMAVYERAGEAALSVPDTGDLRADLEGYLTSIWSWWESSRSGEVLRSFLTEAQFDPETVRTLREDFCPRRGQIIRGMLERAAERGEIQGAAAGLDAAVGLLIGLSWLRLLTDDLGASGDIPIAIDMVVCGLSHPAAAG